METNTNKIYFTITGSKYFYGDKFIDFAREFMKPGTTVILEKEIDNDYDAEAILVKMDGLGSIGHVANSPYTVLGDSYSAGRIYDKFDKNAQGSVLAVLPQGVICTLNM